MNKQIVPETDFIALVQGWDKLFTKPTQSNVEQNFAPSLWFIAKLSAGMFYLPTSV